MLAKASRPVASRPVEILNPSFEINLSKYTGSCIYMHVCPHAHACMYPFQKLHHMPTSVTTKSTGKSLPCKMLQDIRYTKWRLELSKLIHLEISIRHI